MTSDKIRADRLKGIVLNLARLACAPNPPRFQNLLLSRRWMGWRWRILPLGDWQGEKSKLLHKLGQIFSHQKKYGKNLIPPSFGSEAGMSSSLINKQTKGKRIFFTESSWAALAINLSHLFFVLPA